MSMTFFLFLIKLQAPYRARWIINTPTRIIAMPKALNEMNSATPM